MDEPLEPHVAIVSGAECVELTFSIRDVIICSRIMTYY